MVRLIVFKRATWGGGGGARNRHRRADDFFEKILIIFVAPPTIPQHVHHGLTIDEALQATNHPCHPQTLYRHARLEQAAIAARARDETNKLLSEEGPPASINLSSSTSGSAVSEVSPSPTKAMCRSVRERVNPSSSSTRADAAFERGVKAGVRSWVSDEKAESEKNLWCQWG